MQWKLGIGSILIAAFATLPLIAGPQEGKQDRQTQIKKQLAEVRDEQSQVSKMLLELIEQHGTLVMSRDRVLQEMSQLEEQAWNSKLEQEETTIRSEVLRERLKKMVAEVKESESKDEVSALLEKKLALATAKKNRIEATFKSGAIATSELEEVESLVTDAQLALAQHRESKKQSPEADEIKAVTRELAERESDLIVKEKIAILQLKRVEELKASLLKTAEYSDLERTEMSLSRRREHWEELLLQFETEETPAGEPKKDEEDNR
jgi:hypothetical protein